MNRLRISRCMSSLSFLLQSITWPRYLNDSTYLMQKLHNLSCGNDTDAIFLLEHRKRHRRPVAGSGRGHLRGAKRSGGNSRPGRRGQFRHRRLHKFVPVGSAQICLHRPRALRGQRHIIRLFVAYSGAGVDASARS